MSSYKKRWRSKCHCFLVLVSCIGLPTLLLLMLPPSCQLINLWPKCFLLVYCIVVYKNSVGHIFLSFKCFFMFNLVLKESTLKKIHQYLAGLYFFTLPRLLDETRIQDNNKWILSFYHFSPPWRMYLTHWALITGPFRDRNV